MFLSGFWLYWVGSALNRRPFDHDGYLSRPVIDDPPGETHRLIAAPGSCVALEASRPAALEPVDHMGWQLKVVHESPPLCR
jgi:hypothetical protein